MERYKVIVRIGEEPISSFSVPSLQDAEKIASFVTSLGVVGDISVWQRRPSGEWWKVPSVTLVEDS